MSKLPLFTDSATFAAAFLSLPPALPWASLAHLPRPHLAATPAGFADALFAPPPPLSKPSPALERELPADEASAVAEVQAARAEVADDVEPARSQQAAPRRYTRHQLLQLRDAAPPPDEGVRAAVEELCSAAPAAAPPPRERAAPPPPPEAPLPPLLPVACGLWGGAERVGDEGAWLEPQYLADVAAIAPALAALTAAAA